jgi:hypothetical protein
LGISRNGTGDVRDEVRLLARWPQRHLPDVTSGNLRS